MPLPLHIRDVSTHGATLPDSVRIAGTWALTSSENVFGGLSGLSILNDGDLLAVSDTGRFVHIGMTDGMPNGSAGIAPMRFANPLIRPGKLTADAEGLDVRDGLALVSFERNFRILAFALDRCGAQARGVLIAKPPKRFDRVRVRANAGPEAITLDPAGHLQVGYEQPRDGRMVTGRVLHDGTVALSGPVDAPALEPGFRLVGMDHLQLTSGHQVSVRLLRAYERERGNRSILQFGGDLSLPSLRLFPPLTVDNFEGVVLTETQTGLRAYIIADDNFSDRQQTLLYALEIDRDPASDHPDR